MGSQDIPARRPLAMKYKCNGCLMSTNNLAVFKRHKYVHLPLHEKLRRRRFICSWCGHRTTRAHDLKRHRQICKGRPNRVHLPYALVCRMCPHEDDDPVAMKKHETECHGMNKEDYEYSCPGCNHITKKLHDLLYHIVHVHLKGQSIPCDICGVHCASHPKLLEHINKCHVM